MSLRSELCQFHTAAREDEERFSVVSFVEEELTGADRFRVCLTSDARQGVGGQALKQRHSPELADGIRSIVWMSHGNLRSIVPHRATGSVPCASAKTGQA